MLSLSLDSCKYSTVSGKHAIWLSISRVVKIVNNSHFFPSQKWPTHIRNLKTVVFTKKQTIFFSLCLARCEGDRNSWSQLIQLTFKTVTQVLLLSKVYWQLLKLKWRHASFAWISSLWTHFKKDIQNGGGKRSEQSRVY